MWFRAFIAHDDCRNNRDAFLPDRLRRRRLLVEAGAVTDPNLCDHDDLFTGLMLQIVTDGNDSSVRCSTLMLMLVGKLR